METNTKPRRVALITGASRGIGRAIAERLAQDNIAVAIGYNSNTQQAQQVVEGIVQKGGAGIALQVDIADGASVEAFFDAAEKHYGGIDIVVHAAGILHTGILSEMDTATLDSILNTNLKGTLLVNRQAAKRLRNGGALVNLSSAITVNLAPGYGAYAVTKAGVEAITKVLAKELGPKNITVNVVAPGPTDTDMLATDLDATGNSQAYRDAIVGMTPLGRIGTPEDTAGLVAALAGTLHWITGQVIHNSGGIAIS